MVVGRRVALFSLLAVQVTFVWQSVPAVDVYCSAQEYSTVIHRCIVAPNSSSEMHYECS